MSYKKKADGRGQDTGMLWFYVPHSIQEQKKHGRKPMIWVGIGSCAVAAMLAVVLLVNFNPSIAQAMSQVPVINAIVKVVSFRTFESSEKDMNAKVAIPEVEVKDASGRKNDVASKELNDHVKEYTDTIIQQFKKDVKETGGRGKEEVMTSHKVLTDNSRLFALGIETEIVSGSSDFSIKTYHIDKETGTCIGLQDLFERDSDYLKIMTKEIKRQMKEQMKADDGKAYFIDNDDMPELNWKGLTEDADFYVNSKGELTIVFDKYEVAPGYMGGCEFVIPTEVIQGSVKEAYLK